MCVHLDTLKHDQCLLHSKIGIYLTVFSVPICNLYAVQFFSNLKLFFRIYALVSLTSAPDIIELFVEFKARRKKERQIVWHWADIEQIRQWGPRERRILIMVSPSSLPRSSVLLFLLKAFVEKPGSGMLLRSEELAGLWKPHRTEEKKRKRRLRMLREKKRFKVSRSLKRENGETCN